MIVVEVQGGLGNQLFQYAAGRTLADRLKTTLHLDVSSYRDGERNFCLRDFNIRAEIMEKYEAGRLGFGFSPAQRLKRRVRALCCGYWPLAVDRIEETKHRFVAFPDAIERPLYLSGYWQNIGYFADNAATIRADFQPTTPFAVAADMLAEIRQTNSVAVHVRRTDFAVGGYGTCGSAYYRSAIAAIRERIDAPRLFFFSDDIEWVRDNLRFDLPSRYVEPDTAYPSADLWLMAQCRHRVLANSSFSWWGAWLAEHPSPTVIAPTIWNHRRKDWNPTLPGWHLIPADV